jgi:hypothetical protein
MAFRRRLIVMIAAASPSRFSACDRPPACVTLFLAPREGSIGTWLVDGERAPFHSAASRRTIANSTARVPLLIRPYPPRHHTLMRYMPHPLKEGLYPIVFDNEKSHIGRAEREILAPVLDRKFVFKCPLLYMTFPTPYDHADRVVGPLSSLPCQAWHGYGVSNARHGEVKGCRRACERTPLRGHRRAPPSVVIRRALTRADELRNDLQLLTTNDVSRPTIERLRTCIAIIVLFIFYREVGRESSVLLMVTSSLLSKAESSCTTTTKGTTRRSSRLPPIVCCSRGCSPSNR